MKKSASYSILESLGFAFRGIFRAIVKERNVKIHLLATIIVIILGFALKISSLEWLILILTISVVISAEIFNTSLEAFANLMRARLNLDYYETYWVRNFSAAAVLITALGAFIIGLIIFLPKIF
jgi:diacylglycerol kinase